MSVWSVSVFAVAASSCLPLFAQNQRKYEPPAAAPAVVQGNEWSRTLTEQVIRGKLQDAYQFVRGDSGKWSDEHTLLPATLDPTQAHLRMDEQLDRKLAAPAGPLAAGQDAWLLLRTRQYDDNDRAWIAQIDRRGNAITVVMDEAIWQGKYFKTFTYYETYGVNLGKLLPGEYTVEWTFRPRRFQKFSGDGKPSPENWPADDAAAETKPAVLKAKFTVVGEAGKAGAAPAARGDVDRLVRVDQAWAAGGAGGTPSFVKHVVPLFNKVGCSNRSCHGSFQGQGGFQLSLFGYDPAADHKRLLTDGGRRLRVNVKQVEESLALRKPLGTMPHGGDQVLEEGSWQHVVLREWIAAGAPFDAAKAPELKRLEIVPPELRLKKGESASLRVIAHFSDDSREDVTPLATFASNNESVTTVTDDGHVTGGDPGDTAIVVSYAGVVVTCPVIVPQRATAPFPDFPPNNRIDELVVAKLQKVGIHPSALSDDEQFLRRAYIDLIATLPTPDEVRAFLADSRPDKRARVIDDLLERPEYVLYWATIFSDWTGNNGGNPNPAFKTPWLWYDWLCDKLRRNLPYDELIGGILTATSREGRTLDAYLAETKVVNERIQRRTGFDDGTYAKRKTLDLFWLKRTSDLTKELSTRSAENFLGVQIQCAECHKHPFDRWTQADFEGFTSFFRVGAMCNPDGKPFNLGSRDYNTVALYVRPVRGEDPALAKHPPKILAGPVIGYETDGPDPRVALWQWMRSPDNPYFARNLVNRLWHHYFGVGIVDPPQDMNAANPPSNKELLDWLARDFIEHGFDLKHAHRTILNSRTYQLSHVPNGGNRHDRRNFSHALVKRMPAEAAMDALVQVTGTKLEFPNYAAPPGTRSIGMALPIRLGRAEYFMETFGKPPRREICACERSGEPALAQALYLINDDDVQSRIADPAGRLPKLLAELTDDSELVEELYLSALSRRPRAEELDEALAYLNRSAVRAEGAQDLLWTLFNVREFLFVR